MTHIQAAIARAEKAERERDAWKEEAEDNEADVEAGERACVERDALAARVKELEARLQFDPGGSDKIDELECALQFLRHEAGALRSQIAAATSEVAKGRAYDAFVEAYERGCCIAYSLDAAMAAALKVEQ